MTKLPVGRLARHAYLDVIGNARGLARVGGLWLLLGWALLLLGRSGWGWLAAIADVVVTLGAAAIAVTWHRHILLNEPLTRRMAPLDARVARYFALTVLLALLLGVTPLLVLLLAGGGAPPAAGAAGPALLLVPAAMIACLYLALRLQLVFPATAIGDAAMTFGRSWALTQGNGWRLFLGFLMVSLPAGLAALGLALLLGRLAELSGSVALAALADLAAVANAWLQAPLIASFLSYAYIFFQKQGQEETPTTSPG